jgi:hypothetical protein
LTAVIPSQGASGILANNDFESSRFPSITFPKHATAAACSSSRFPRRLSIRPAPSAMRLRSSSSDPLYRVNLLTSRREEPDPSLQRRVGNC